MLTIGPCVVVCNTPNTITLVMTRVYMLCGYRADAPATRVELLGLHASAAEAFAQAAQQGPRRPGLGPNTFRVGAYVVWVQALPVPFVPTAPWALAQPHHPVAPPT